MFNLFLVDFFMNSKKRSFLFTFTKTPLTNAFYLIIHVVRFIMA